ncbi:MAG: helix-hairpin-helix domain-containing protein [Lentisphaerae bacterium]|nr:helix-hairpin-helix domain-containing protein [Lentisphaerota bacterium]
MKPIRTIVIALIVATMARGGSAAELKRLDGATLVADPWNDGDSFKVSHAGKELTLRLYFVDCPETGASSATDARRVRDQTRYFGLPGYDRTTHFAREASAFVQQTLATAFTVHTAYASASGRGRKNRYYAFVTTAQGEDLAHLLVRRGYARCFGVRRALADGTTGEEARARLCDTELSAMLDRRGIWAETDGERLVELRATARIEAEELAQIGRESRAVGRIDLNTASIQDLEAIHGVGPQIASRIISSRPFAAPQDLARVPHIPHNVLTNLQHHFTLE